jgi:hypothetical protein
VQTVVAYDAENLLKKNFSPYMGAKGTEVWLKQQYSAAAGSS